MIIRIGIIVKISIETSAIGGFLMNLSSTDSSHSWQELGEYSLSGLHPHEGIQTLLAPNNDDWLLIWGPSVVPPSEGAFVKENWAVWAVSIGVGLSLALWRLWVKFQPRFHPLSPYIPLYVAVPLRIQPVSHYQPQPKRKIPINHCASVFMVKWTDWHLEDSSLSITPTCLLFCLWICPST